MACASLLAVALAVVTPAIPDAVQLNAPATGPSVPMSRPAIAKPIDLSVSSTIHNPTIPSSGKRPLLALHDTDHWNDGDASPGISLGPLRAEFGGVTGRHMHLATMKLEGVSVLGASVGGSVDSRSARITLSWPSSP